MRVTVLRELGLTLSNFPISIFPIMLNGRYTINDGSLVFDTDQSNKDFIIDEIQGVMNPVNISFSETMNNGLIIRRDIQNEVEDGTIEIPEEQQIDGPIREAEICGDCYYPIDECVCDAERCEECGEIVDECNCPPEEVDVASQGSSNPELYRLVGNRIATQEQISIEIGSKIQECAENSKMLQEELRQYTKLLNMMIQRQRKIDLLRKNINKNEVVAYVIDQIEKVKANNQFVEDAFIVKDHIVVTTKTINTNELTDGHIYNIGKLAFFISTKVFVMAGDSDGCTPVKIINMTREMHGFACGHVKSHGQICFGEWSSPLIKAFADSDLESIVEILFRFVKTPNLIDEWGEKIKYFPVVRQGD